MTPSVLMFCPTFRPIVGGAERQAERLARGLAAAGARVTIATPRVDGASPDREEFDGVRLQRIRLSDLSRTVPVRGIALVNLPVVLTQVARAVRRLLRDHDVLHCHVACVPTVGAALAGRLAGRPVLCKAAIAGHDSDLGEVRRAGATGPAVARMAAALVDRWVATTEDVEQALVRGGIRSDRIARIPNGIDVPDAAYPQRAGGVRRILYLGRLSSNIGRDTGTLLAAFERIAARCGEAELALVGGGDLLEDVREAAQASPFRDRIAVPGFSSAAEWLAWADCFVLPSVREGLSNALLEAMAAGLPCVANDIPANREVLGDGAAGLLVPVGDTDALGAALASLMDDPGRSHGLARAARQRVREMYSMDHVAQLHLELYDDLLRHSRNLARAGTRAG